MTPPDHHRELRDTLGHHPAGIALIGAVVSHEPVGLLVSSFTSVSLDPPLVSVGFDRASTTWPVLRDARTVGISVLSEAHLDVVGTLRLPAPRRFAGVDVTRTPEGALLLPHAAVQLEVSLHEVLPGGDHDIALWRVLSHAADASAAPLVFHRRAVVALGGPPSAPSDPGRTPAP